jgi:hypothetical protein
MNSHRAALHRRRFAFRPTDRPSFLLQLLSKPAQGLVGALALDHYILIDNAPPADPHWEPAALVARIPVDADGYHLADATREAVSGLGKPLTMANLGGHRSQGVGGRYHLGFIEVPTIPQPGSRDLAIQNARVNLAIRDQHIVFVAQL